MTRSWWFVMCCAAASCGGGARVDLDGGGELTSPDGGKPATGTSKDGGPGGTSIDPGASGDDASCGGQQFGITRVPPNVMLVLDRSGSMMQPIAIGSKTSKWTDLVMAVQTLVTDFDASMLLGADIFSDPNATGGGGGGGGGQSCAAGPIAVALGASHGAQIMTLLNKLSPNGSTPTAATMDEVIANGKLNDPTRQNYVVLVTDGLPTCNDTDVTSRITKLYNQTPSVKTYVIGVGSDTQGQTALDDWAVAGHTDQAGATKYYQASQPADLMAAFNAIGAGVTSCTFKLSQVPPDPSELYVWLNGTMLKVDPANGYSYDAAGPSVTLNGTSCTTLKSNPATKVNVIYGCPTAPIG